MVSKTKQNKKKKIVYIGSFRNLWDEEGNARSLEKLGCEVIRIPEETFRFNEALFKIKEIKPDLVLTAKLNILTLRDAFLDKLKRNKVYTVAWLWDLYFGLLRQQLVTRDPIFKTDLVLSPDGGHNKEFKGYGVNHKVLRQAIYDEYCYKGEFKEKYDYDVVFVGCENLQWLYRTELCHFLDKNYKFRWFGRNNTLEIRGDELNDLYASAKIVIGDSVISSHYWTNRIYETLGRGGFLIWPEIKGFDAYEPYKHFIPYKMRDWEGLKEKIDYFLKKPEEREKISKSALEYTKKHHTLLNRSKQLLEMI